MRCGQGDRGGTDSTLFGLAKLVHEFLETLELTDATLVATDAGGAIAQAVAARHSERIGWLVLTPCDAFDNFLPLPIKHLQVFGRTPAGLYVLAQSLRLRLVQRLPIAFGLRTERPALIVCARERRRFFPLEHAHRLARVLPERTARGPRRHRAVRQRGSAGSPWPD